MTPFDMPSIVPSLVAMDLSRHFDIFDFENTATLKSGSGVIQDHLNWYHSTDWLWFSISVL